MKQEESQIRKFYDGCNIFITGGTGFMGKILLEKLLRTTNVATIYLLIRDKKGKNLDTRLEELFDNVVFDKLREKSPKFKHRVVGIPGDCSISGLGMTIKDRQKLLEEVDVVFHVAATVRFDENIKLAYDINVNGAEDVVKLCRQMKKLKAAIHVSTAYSNCPRSVIDEMFYDDITNYESIKRVLEKMSVEESEEATPTLINKWPNTYTFTKALAESLIKDLGKGLPIGVFRPSIIVSTFKEPIEGWIDNLYGPTGVCAAAGSGLLRVLHCDGNVVADIVPIDTCVAAIIACAWDVASRDSKEKKDKIPIYNYVSSVENPITWGEYNTLNMIHGTNYPLNSSIWTVKFRTEKNYGIYLIFKILLHILPAFFFDLGAFMLGYRPRLLNMYKKIHKFSNVISFFCTREWKFHNANVRNLWNKMNETDKELFPFSITKVPWLIYFKTYYIGIRTYLMQEPLHNLEEAKNRKQRFDVLHWTIKFILNFILIVLIWTIIASLWTKLIPTTEMTSNSTTSYLQTVCSKSHR